MVTTLFLRVTFYGMVPATRLTKSNTLAYPIFEFYLHIFAIYLAHWIQQPIPKLQIQILNDFSFHFLQFWFVYSLF